MYIVSHINPNKMTKKITIGLKNYKKQYGATQ